MKTLIIQHLAVVLALLVVGCASKGPEDLENSGKGLAYTQAVKKAFGDNGDVEASLLNVGGEIVAIHGASFKGSMNKSLLGASGLEQKGMQALAGSNYAFQYVFEHGGAYYNFVTRDSNIYLLKSSDLVNWREINGGRPVLTKAPGTIYAMIWNVAAAVDDNGVWHLLAETSDGTGTPEVQWGVGLAYSHATMTGEDIEFDTNRTSSYVIPKGGNPDVKFVPGKGILVVHGVLEGVWTTQATTFVNGVWTTHSDFVIGRPGIHVCDPHLVERADGTTLLSVSFDQGSTTITQSSLSIAGLWDMLTQ